MSLSTKIAAILTVLIVSLTAIGGTLQNRVFGRLFSSIEKEEAGAELVRVREALGSEIQDCVRSARRVATHPPTLRFIGAPADAASARYRAEELSAAALVGDELDLLYVCAPSGEVLGGELLDPDTREPISMPRDFPRGALSANHPAHVRPDQGETPAGMIETARGPILLGTAPVMAPVDEEGTPPRMVGFVVAGRFLEGGLSERISRRTQADLKAAALHGDRSSLPEDMRDVVDEVTASAAPVLRVRDGGETLAIYSTFDDIRRRPMFLLRTRMDRRISAAGETALASGALTDATLGLTILLALLVILNQVVLRPIKALTAHAVETGRNENFRAKFGLERDDEIGTLGTAFDEMMSKLEQARSALVETARTAGMSEIATGILHNVGNVLNSVNISASLVSQRVEGLCIDDLERLAEVITEHKDDLPRFLTEDPRGQHIQPFLSALVVELSQEQVSIRSEVDSLTSGIDHICELIKSQQSLAKGAKLVEPTDLTERLDEALRITQRVHGVDDSLVVVRRFEDLPEVALDKHKLLEILVNLVQNARQAMSAVDGPRELTLALARAGDGRIRITVEDSGVGIAQEDLTRVFNMGFTTREEGHGFGLHSSANAAVEMGGRLWAESDGPGRGARFVLELPMEPGGSRSQEQRGEVAA